MSINPGTQNIENLGNSAETLRLIFRALDLEIFAHDSTGKTSLFRPRPRFAQSHLPDHHSNPSTFSRIPPAPTETHNSGAHPPRRAAPTAYCPLPTVHCLPPTTRRAGPAWNSRGTMPARRPCIFRPPRPNIVPSISDFIFCAPHQTRSPYPPHVLRPAVHSQHPHTRPNCQTPPKCCKLRGFVPHTPWTLTPAP